MAALGRLQPPVNEDAVASDTGTHTQAWTEYHQSVADRLAATPDMVTTGVTDGSDAAAGKIGEYLTATVNGVPIANNVLTTIASLNLTPGDWDVSGNVVFHLTGVTATAYGAGVDNLQQLIGGTMPTSSGLWMLGTGAPTRRNTVGAITVHLVAQSGFSAGSILVDGTVHARRVR